MKRVVVGTRGTPLALIQTQEVVDKLREKRPDVEFEVKVLRTAGDRAAEAPLRSLGVGIFVKEIEEALLRGEIDMAVHSHKDLLPLLAPGIDRGRSDGAVGPSRRAGQPLERQPGRPARRRQNRHKQPPPGCPTQKMGRPMSTFCPCGAAWAPASKKATSDDYDGVVLAAAGILRLGLEEKISQYLPADKFVPAPGQGALAAEIRSDDHATSWMLRSIDHTPTRRVVMAEMAFLERLGSGCQEPAAAYARVVRRNHGDAGILGLPRWRAVLLHEGERASFQSPRVGYGGSPAAHREGSRGARARDWAVKMRLRDIAIGPVAIWVLSAW